MSAAYLRWAYPAGGLMLLAGMIVALLSRVG